MAYTTREKIESVIPADFLERSFWKEGEEESGVIDTIISIADNEIDGYLAGRYTVPFSAPLPGMVANAALIITCDLIYRRNSVPNEGNPWNQSAKDIREALQAISNGSAILGEVSQSALTSMEDATLRYDP